MPPKTDHGHGHSPDAGAAGAFRNHGAEVSAAARDAPRGHGENHGQVVSEVANGNASQPTAANPSTTSDIAADESEPRA